MRSRTRIAALAGLRDRGKARIGFQPVDRERHRRQRPERLLGIGQHDLDQALDQVGFDRGVGTAFDAQRGLAAAAAEQHVDDRIDQAGIDGGEAEVFPLLGLEHAEHGRQRYRVHVVAEPHRGDAVERDFDVVGGEIAQARGHQPHQAVEHDFEHRQTLVGHHRGIDDGANAGIVVEIDVADGEAEQIVDFFLRQNPLAAGLVAEVAAAVLDHGGPLQGHALREFIGRGFFRRRRRILGIERGLPLGGNRVLVEVFIDRP